MCIIELVDYNETMLKTGEEAAKPKRRRSRRGSSTKTEAPAANKGSQAKSKSEAPVKEQPKAEAPKQEPGDEPSADVEGDKKEE